MAYDIEFHKKVSLFAINNNNKVSKGGRGA